MSQVRDIFRFIELKNKADKQLNIKLGVTYNDIFLVDNPTITFDSLEELSAFLDGYTHCKENK